jgi:hypothetical protein
MVCRTENLNDCISFQKIFEGEDISDCCLPPLRSEIQIFAAAAPVLVPVPTPVTLAQPHSRTGLAVEPQQVVLR